MATLEREELRRLLKRFVRLTVLMEQAAHLPISFSICTSLHFISTRSAHGVAQELARLLEQAVVVEDTRYPSFHPSFGGALPPPPPGWSYCDERDPSQGFVRVRDDEEEEEDDVCSTPRRPQARGGLRRLH